MILIRRSLSSDDLNGRISRRLRAFTLVELMMAVGVFSLAVVTSITTLQRAFNNLDTARNIETASRIIQCEMEKQRLMTWAQVGAATNSPAIDSIFQSNPAVAGHFTLSRSTATVANRSGKILQITLTVSWRNYAGHTHQRSLTSYYGNGGLHTYLTTQA